MTQSVVEIEIHDLARAGSGVGRTPDGRVIFIPLTAPGDLVRARITHSEKRHAQAELIEVLRPSPLRQKPPCPVFGRCGGCQWQHLPYELQWKTKSQGVLQALKRVNVTAPSLEELPAEQIWEYRNRIQLHGKGDALGFFAPSSRTLIPIERCEIARPELNSAFGKTREEAAKRNREQREYPEYPEYKVELEIFENGELRKNWNQAHAALGFRQIHDAQNQKLRAWVAGVLAKSAKDTGAVLDLFGGNGNLSLAIALQNAQRLIHCIDSSAPLERSENTPKNLHFHRKPVARWLAQNKEKVSATTAIIDPPREGLDLSHDKIATALEQVGVRAIAAIGCDLDSWARDISKWVKRGWTLERVGALDFFPQTTHIESLGWLTRV